MDAFEKLAKLAGASVESVGEGLPRTRAEALALGVPRYFTGKPCLHGHVGEWAAHSGRCYECSRQSSKKSHAKKRKIEGFVPKRIFDGRGNERAKAKWDHMNYAKSAKDKELFAISQAIRAAASGVFRHDITEFCAESTRINLQQLIDKVKNDGMPVPEVLDILRTMRELRKAELAEMKAGVDAEAASGTVEYMTALAEAIPVKITGLVATKRSGWLVAVAG